MIKTGDNLTLVLFDSGVGVVFPRWHTSAVKWFRDTIQNKQTTRKTASDEKEISSFARSICRQTGDRASERVSSPDGQKKKKQTHMYIFRYVATCKEENKRWWWWFGFLKASDMVALSWHEVRLNKKNTWKIIPCYSCLHSESDGWFWCKHVVLVHLQQAMQCSSIEKSSDGEGGEYITFEPVHKANDQQNHDNYY